MKESNMWITASVVFTISLIAGYAYSSMAIDNNPFKDKGLLEKGLNLPIIWLYYDNSDVNSRYWADFGSRSTRALNIPFLNMCYDNIVSLNNKEYRVEVIGGLQGVAERLGGVEAMPHKMRNLISAVGEPEMNWIRAAILAKFGGLWLEPSSICLQKFGNLPEKVIFFGTDFDETFSGQAGTTVPGFRAIWCYKANHPIFVQWAETAYDRIEYLHGGNQIRGDAKWDWIEYAYGKPDVEVRAEAEAGRMNENGKRIQLDDILAAGQEGRFPFSISKKAIYVPISLNELKGRRSLGWFLRMSEEQILESDLIIKYIFMLGSGY
jgi:hypothetical protein